MTALCPTVCLRVLQADPRTKPGMIEPDSSASSPIKFDAAKRLKHAAASPSQHAAGAPSTAVQSTPTNVSNSAKVCTCVAYASRVAQGICLFHLGTRATANQEIYCATCAGVGVVVVGRGAKTGGGQSVGAFLPRRWLCIAGIRGHRDARAQKRVRAALRYAHACVLTCPCGPVCRA